MGADTRIEWADHTFNPWTGCQRVSPGCDHCYAEALAKRAPKTFGSWLPGGERKRTSEAYWRQPLLWNKRAGKEGRRARVFCASMADVFDNHVPDDWRRDLWATVEATPHLDWLLLTKRPQNIARMVPAPWGDGWPNVWLGTTVENQEEADRRIPHLLAVPAAKRFLSCEPLLGPVDLREIVLRRDGERQTELSARLGDWVAPLRSAFTNSPRIHWVIAGGESGPKARPSHPDWFRSLRDQCVNARVPYFHKQNGEWVSVSEVEGPGKHYRFPDGATVRRTGKQRAGATLDGREWREIPQ